jgi:hypothetical protein
VLLQVRQAVEKVVDAAGEQPSQPVATAEVIKSETEQATGATTELTTPLGAGANELFQRMAKVPAELWLGVVRELRRAHVRARLHLHQLGASKTTQRAAAAKAKQRLEEVETDTDAVVRKSYRLLSLRYHPDRQRFVQGVRGTTPSQGMAAASMAALTTAMEVLVAIHSLTHLFILTPLLPLPPPRLCPPPHQVLGDTNDRRQYDRTRSHEAFLAAKLLRERGATSGARSGARRVNGRRGMLMLEAGAPAQAPAPRMVLRRATMTGVGWMGPQVIVVVTQCTCSISVINQCTYSIAVINQCTYSIAVVNQCTYSIAVINQCTYSI